MSDCSVDDVYFEKVKPPVYFQYFLYGVVGLLGYLTLTEMADMPSIIGVIGLSIVFVISSIFGTMTARITESALMVGFGFIQHTIALDNIDYIEVRKFPWWRYGGFGIRFGFDWSIGYIQNYKRGIYVTPKRGRRLFFSTNRVEKLAEVLQKRIDRPV